MHSCSKQIVIHVAGKHIFDMPYILSLWGKESSILENLSLKWTQLQPVLF